MAISIDSRTGLGRILIMSDIESSVTTVSCTRLSMRGLASDARTGVTKSTQYDESRVVRRGICSMSSLLPSRPAYILMRSS